MFDMKCIENCMYFLIWLLLFLDDIIIIGNFLKVEVFVCNRKL